MTHLVCKNCGTRLTKLGLYKASMKSRYRPAKSQYFVRRRNKLPWYYDSVFITNPSSYLEQDQLKFVRGWGCCGNSGHPLTCSCSSEVGSQYLDCYESKNLHFYIDKVEERHKD
jgi:hypothetical protein